MIGGLGSVSRAVSSSSSSDSSEPRVTPVLAHHGAVTSRDLYEQNQQILALLRQQHEVLHEAIASLSAKVDTLVHTLSSGNRQNELQIGHRMAPSHEFLTFGPSENITLDLTTTDQTTVTLSIGNRLAEPVIIATKCNHGSWFTKSRFKLALAGYETTQLKFTMIDETRRSMREIVDPTLRVAEETVIDIHGKVLPSEGLEFLSDAGDDPRARMERLRNLWENAAGMEMKKRVIVSVRWPPQSAVAEAAGPTLHVAGNDDGAEPAIFLTGDGDLNLLPAAAVSASEPGNTCQNADGEEEAEGDDEGQEDEDDNNNDDDDDDEEVDNEELAVDPEDLEELKVLLSAKNPNAESIRKLLMSNFGWTWTLKKNKLLNLPKGLDFVAAYFVPNAEMRLTRGVHLVLNKDFFLFHDQGPLVVEAKRRYLYSTPPLLQNPAVTKKRRGPNDLESWSFWNKNTDGNKKTRL